MSLPTPIPSPPLSSPHFTLFPTTKVTGVGTQITAGRVTLSSTTSNTHQIGSIFLQPESQSHDVSMMLLRMLSLRHQISFHIYGHLVVYLYSLVFYTSSFHELESNVLLHCKLLPLIGGQRLQRGCQLERQHKPHKRHTRSR